jgi:hypothetical protein
MDKQLRVMDPGVRVLASVAARQRNSGMAMERIADGLRHLGRQTMRDVAYVLREDLGWTEPDADELVHLVGRA